jgi:large subunit ribosomal protein L35
MPKMKSHSGAKKRFKVTASGKVKRGHQGKSHILSKKTTKRKRRLRSGAYVSATQERTIKSIIPYKA